MSEGNHHPPGLVTLLGRVLRTGVGAARNRFELFSVEWQEERLRLVELLVWTAGLVFLGVMATLLLTATIIFLFAENLRLYATAGFAILYLAGAVGAWFGVKKQLNRRPFTESIDQAKKDGEWLKSFQ